MSESERCSEETPAGRAGLEDVVFMTGVTAPVTAPSHDTQSRHQSRHPVTTPCHGTQPRHPVTAPVTTPSHGTQSRYPATTPSHGTQSRHPVTAPSHGTQPRHPATAPCPTPWTSLARTPSRYTGPHQQAADCSGPLYSTPNKAHLAYRYIPRRPSWARESIESNGVVDAVKLAVCS